MRDDAKENLDFKNDAKTHVEQATIHKKGALSASVAPNPIHKPPTVDGLSRPSAFIPVGEHRFNKRPENINIPEMATMASEPDKPGHGVKSAFHSLHAPWKSGLVSPDFSQKTSMPRYIRPMIPEYPPQVYSESGLPAVFTSYLFPPVECDNPMLSVYAPDQRPFLSHHLQATGLPLPKPINASLEHYRLLHQFQQNPQLHYGFYRPTEHPFLPYSLKIPAMSSLSKDLPSQTVESSPYVYHSASVSRLYPEEPFQKVSECQKETSPGPTKNLNSKNESESVKMSPRAGSAATGSPGRPSPTNFTQNSQGHEGIFNLSGKPNSASAECEKTEKHPTAFKPVRRSTDPRPAVSRDSSPCYERDISQLQADFSIMCDRLPCPSKDDAPMAPLNLSKRPEVETGDEADLEGDSSSSTDPADIMDLQDVPLNLSIKDSGKREKVPFAETSHVLLSEQSPGFTVTRSTDNETLVPTVKQTFNIMDCGDEQKQSAAVALCQLATYSPGTVSKVTEEEKTAVPQQKATSPPAHRDLETHSIVKLQKRTISKEHGKSQGLNKKTKSVDSERMFTLRKRPRMS
ncbi:hypothetical protein GDO86_013779 [Hymenochirus boettgeri]|uniref:Uncharacterized protein n=1 Tax=Hymenochirus boettgeri TaxID=247094 RepID=A0A8T2JLH0_9PIPI|nr:hypothetical protein GDO86_013779 [Hymenochirus boettgeri]